MKKQSLVALVIGGLTLTPLFWIACPQKAAAQDLFTDLAMLGLQLAAGTETPHCALARVSAISRRPPRPTQDVNIGVYPAPAPPRSMDAQVWPEPQPPRRSMDVRVTPEPIARRVGSDTSGGYVMNGSTPAPQPVAQAGVPTAYPSPARDISPTQEQLRGH